MAPKKTLPAIEGLMKPTKKKNASVASIFPDLSGFSASMRTNAGAPIGIIWNARDSN